MSLTLNIDPDVFRGGAVQNFKVIHEGKEIIISVYRSRGHLLKMRFNGPLDFRIVRYKTSEIPDEPSLSQPSKSQRHQSR